ncbi:MAG TPA: aminotransferase class I/II-fold pyridoxal phosphate-dependent enzyme, partial [Oceanospirillales bacterium]|nr:aminotransferase class I/II-fold pyridoxal phosphate-dependent enzyme [Oceanospirillales bacterium]
MKRNFPPLRMTEFSRQYAGKNLVSMHNTNPQVFTQKELEQTIGKSMAEILQDVNLGFSADEGTEVLRHVIAKNLYKTRQAAEIITHAGAAEALFCAFHAILQANDKVLIVAPVFEPLVQVPKNLGCEIEFIHLNSEDDWSLDFNELEEIFKQGCQLF